IGPGPRIVPDVEMGQSAVDVGPGQVRPQCDSGAVAGNGRVELAQADIAIAEQQVVGEVLEGAMRYLLKRRQDLTPLSGRRGGIRAPWAMEPVQDVPVAIGGRTRRDGCGLSTESAGLILAAGQAGQVGSLEQQGAGRRRFAKGGPGSVRQAGGELE